MNSARGDAAGAWRGYRSPAERFTKTRRLAVLRERLATAERALAAGHPSMVVGGKRLWRHRNHLEAAEMTEQQWRERWDAARMFLTADGESGKPGGNETIRVDEQGRLRVKVPAALADELGTHLVIGAPVGFAHRGAEWAERVAARRAVRYDISFDPDRGRWYLDASWTTTPEPAPDTGGCCAPGRCWVWISTPITWRPVCWIARATRSVNPPPSGLPPRVCRRRAVMGGYAQHQHAARPRRAAELWRGGGGESRLRRRPRHRPGNTGPRRARQTFRRTVAGIPPASSAPGSPRWPPAAVSG